LQLDQNFKHSDSGINSSFDLKALQAKVQGGVGQDLSYSFRLKNKGGIANMDQAQLTYSGFNSWSKVSVGQVSMPYGLGTSFTADSLATQTFSPSAGKDSLGFAVTAWNDQFGVTCSVHQPTSAAVTSVKHFDTAGRISFSPLTRDNLILHVGANAYLQHDAGDFGGNLTLEGDKKRGFGLDAAVLRGPLFVQGELHQVTTGPESSAMGYNVEASFALTGETRDYNKITGAFSSLRTERDSGSWLASARFSGISQKETPSHNRVGAGLAWTVNNNLTVLADYENKLDTNDGSLALRLQAAW